MKAGNHKVEKQSKTIFELQRMVVQNKHSYVVILYMFEKLSNDPPHDNILKRR